MKTFVLLLLLTAPLRAQFSPDAAGRLALTRVDSTGSAFGVTDFVTQSLNGQTMHVHTSTGADSLSIDGIYPSGTSILIDKRDAGFHTYIRCGVEGETIQGAAVYDMTGPKVVLLVKLNLQWRVYAFQ